MKEKSKIVEIDGTRYQVRRLMPDVGSHILSTILTAGLRGARGMSSAEEASPSVGEQKAEPPVEDVVRVMVLAACGEMDFATRRFIQTKCLAVCSRMESANDGPELPMPIVNDAGVWAITEIRDNLSLVLRLEMEALVFNLSDFLEKGGMKSLLETRTSKT